MTSARLYILCGLPFAGKSSLASVLRQRYGCTVIAIDAINSARGLGSDAAPAPITPSQWNETYAEAYRRIDAALAARETVIFDATSYTRSQRDDLRRIAAAHGVSAHVMYLAVPATVCRERWLRNRQTRIRFDVRDGDFKHVVAHFEPPEMDEAVIVYDQSQPPEDWVARLEG